MHCYPYGSRRRPGRGRARGAVAGFTLIELMIAVVILAILTTLAWSSYADYVLRGHVADGTNGLATIRSRMERHYQDNRTYATVGTIVTPCASANAATRTFGTFVVSCSGTPTATAFTLQAVGSGAAAGFTFTVNQADARATTAAPGSWGTCATRWILKRGAPC
jgi:type IV pilus assembly protein PilE